MLASREVEIPLTHDLGYLVKLVDALPDEVADSRWLTPWAGGWRYDTEGSPADRDKALRAAEGAVGRAGTIVSGASAGTNES